jgi:hypothetical protein
MKLIELTAYCLLARLTLQPLNLPGYTASHSRSTTLHNDHSENLRALIQLEFQHRIDLQQNVRCSAKADSRIRRVYLARAAILRTISFIHYCGDVTVFVTSKWEITSMFWQYFLRPR